MSLVIKNIRHQYQQSLAVQDANLSVEPGEIVSLVGASGCGKTTLLRLAAGLEPVQSGSVDLDGVRLSDSQIHVPAEDRAIGFVFQDYVLFPHMTVAENIAFGLKHLKRKEKQARISEQLAAIDMIEFAKRYPHELSGGQQQRIALARAFARRPRAMLLDEPFASIDVVRRRRLRDDVRTILKSHKAASILVTHDPEEALAMGDKIAIMKEGRILETASAEGLYHNPKTPEGAALFPGAQTIRVMAREGYLYTVFGDIQKSDDYYEADLAVIRDGAAMARAMPDGVARVLDSRFVGPNWRVRLRDDLNMETLLAYADHPIEVGARAEVVFDPAGVHMFCGA